MSPVTHFLTGWVLASAVGLDRRERAVASVAAVIPDVDGLGIIPEMLTRHSQHPLLWFSEYHHDLHTLLFALVVSLVASYISGYMGAVIAFVSFHLHLLEDVVGSRGPDGFAWPIPYLFPFTNRWSWTWRGQWELNSWPNIAFTAALMCAALWITVMRGYSPAELFSSKADGAIVASLQKRFLTAQSPSANE